MQKNINKTTESYDHAVDFNLNPTEAGKFERLDDDDAGSSVENRCSMFWAKSMWCEMWLKNEHQQRRQEHDLVRSPPIVTCLAPQQIESLETST